MDYNEIIGGEELTTHQKLVELLTVFTGLVVIGLIVLLGVLIK